MVGLIPLLAVTTIEPALLEKVPEFKSHLEWFLEHRPDLVKLVSRWYEPRMGERRLLAILRGHRMKRVLFRMLDENEFLSPYGIRALSRIYADQPYALNVDGSAYTVAYQPAESESSLFGGNSNWRGPVWFPVNYLIIESLQQFHHYYSDDFLVEYPTHSGKKITLNQIADEISSRLINLFRRDITGRRAVFGRNETFQNDPHWNISMVRMEPASEQAIRPVGRASSPSSSSSRVSPRSDLLSINNCQSMIKMTTDGSSATF
jgi:glycosyl hydrolase family 63